MVWIHSGIGAIECLACKADLLTYMAGCFQFLTVFLELMYYKHIPNVAVFRAPAFEESEHGSFYIHRRVHSLMGYWKMLGILGGEA